ncbi:MAG: hypothetical protein JSS81_27765 [Acidobacteria bacterium]|nr:hypothetical protein [Acidobacteriota bacterium]
MKKLFATFLLLMCVTVAFAGKVDDSAGLINNQKQYSLCHDETGKWNPQDKNCDPNSCGCLFHQIEHFIIDLFE